jgi:inner membrane protein
MNAIIETIAPPSPWFWLSIGVLLAAAETVVPGFFLIWLAVAAIATGLTVAVAPMGFAIQLFVFAVFAIISVYAARKYMKDNPIISTDPLLNDRAARMVGDVVTVTQPIENGRGRVRIGDSEWNVKGPDTAADGRVRIVGSDGSVLLVEAA